MRVIEFTVPGQPVALPRERVTVVRGKPRHYKDQSTGIVAYQQAVRLVARQHCQTPLEDWVSLQLYFDLALPPRSKWPDYPCVKPDIDNLVKGVLDALNGVAYVDDAQVVTITASKNWGEPCTRIKITGPEATT